jgi:hypothetical protein
MLAEVGGGPMGHSTKPLSVNQPNKKLQFIMMILIASWEIWKLCNARSLKMVELAWAFGSAISKGKVFCNLFASRKTLGLPFAFG